MLAPDTDRTMAGRPGGVRAFGSDPDLVLSHAIAVDQAAGIVDEADNGAASFGLHMREGGQALSLQAEGPKPVFGLSCSAKDIRKSSRFTSAQEPNPN
jgi:hypothetical protein